MSAGAQRRQSGPFRLGDKVQLTGPKGRLNTITLEAGKYYTLLMTGTQRNNRSYINVIEDARGTAPSGAQIAVHAINAGVDPVDVYALASETAPVSGSAAVAGLAIGKAQPYVIRPTGAFAFGATASGSTSLLAAALAPAGAAPGGSR